VDFPTLPQVRLRSDLLTELYPDPVGNNKLTVLIEDASALVSSGTGRIIGAAGTGPFGCPLEEVPVNQAPVVYRAVTRKAEQMALNNTSAARKAELKRLQGGLASFSAGPYCVPMDTEALTDKGWRSYSDLCVGDMVLGYDAEAGVSRWTPILDIMEPVEADLVSMGNKNWSVRCTPNHRWVTRDRWMEDGRYVEGDWSLNETTSLEGRRAWDVLVAAPADTVSQLPISAAEAALIGWLWTNGCVQRDAAPKAVRVKHSPMVDGFTQCAYCSTPVTYGGRGMPKRFCDGCYPLRRAETNRSAIRGRFSQKSQTAALAGVLSESGATYKSTGVDESGHTRFRLESHWLLGLWERARLDHLSPSEFVLQLGPEQREAFLEAGLWAEGNSRWDQGPTRGQGQGPFYRRNFTQNPGPILDAFVLAAYLSGYEARTPRNPGKCSGFRIAMNYNSGQSLRIKPDGREKVWCITTGLGSWTMRQGRHITLTGNSESYFQGGASRSAKETGQIDPDPVIDMYLKDLMTDCVRVGWMRWLNPNAPYPPGYAIENSNWFPEDSQWPSGGGLGGGGFGGLGSGWSSDGW
jgi:hypothetical protein